MENNLRIKGKVHFIGIGGCSMNGLAQILKNRGYEVQGSDSTTSPYTKRLEQLDIPVIIGQRAENVDGCDTIIYSAAIKPDNPERVRAREIGIPEIERSVALGIISESYSEVVGIAGCHGKTTITSMLAVISEFGGLDATVHVGGMVDFLNGGIRIGSRDLFVTEACEYVESFLTLRPTVVLINNIDDDHLDYFKDIEHITDAFRKFIARMPEKNGLLIGCADDNRVRKLLAEYNSRKLTYGINIDNNPDYYPYNIVYDEFGCGSFDLMNNGECMGRIVLHVPGQHNVLNALAAAVAAIAYGTETSIIANALSNFHSVQRRFEYYGERDGVRVFHDYAHHPAEIRAAIDCGIKTPHNRIFIVFQCNSYTRAKTLFLKNVDCFKGADEVLVPDIYPGREIDDGSVHARDMVIGINAETENAKYIATFEEINDYLKANAKSGDIVITLGSGDVYKQSKILIS